jgi:hypothetical protein
MAFEEFEDCFVWRCDTCAKSAIFPPDDFWRALRELKSRGWLVERWENEWAHTCAKCRKSSAEILDRPVRPLKRVQ